MRGFVCALLALAACGRIGFDPLAGTGTTNDGATSDVPLGAVCGGDGDCGPCQRCNTGHCADEPIVDLIIGHRTTCFLGTGGSRWCTGLDTGTGSSSSPLFPVHLAGDDGWTDLHIGYMQGFGIRNSAIYSWGDYASTPMLTTTDISWQQMTTEITGVCFLRASGALTCNGASIAGTWLFADTGESGMCGIQTDHSLWCWGADYSNTLGQGVEADGTVIVNPAKVGTATDWQDVGIGNRLACARKLDNTIWCWGEAALSGTNNVDTLGVPTKISPRTDWTNLTVAYDHACAGLPGGSRACWGGDGLGLEVLPGMGEVPVPTVPTDTWDQFRVGGHHYCGQTGGRWYCWGRNDEGALGVGDTVTRQTPSVPLCTPAT